MTELPVKNPAWISFCQLLQQLIAGDIRRNTFTQWEMHLLLDVEMTPMRKALRPEILRRYLRAVQCQHASGAHMPVRFSQFFETETIRKTSAAAEPEMVLPRAS